MHDGKDACAHEIIAAGGDRIGKQPTDMGILPAREARRARRDEAVDVAALQEFGNGDVLWRVLHAHAGWELDGDLLRPAGVLDPAPHPDNVGRLHAVVRSEEHTSELQSPCNLVCRLLLEKKKKK